MFGKKVKEWIKLLFSIWGSPYGFTSGFGPGHSCHLLGLQGAVQRKILQPAFKTACSWSLTVLWTCKERDWDPSLLCWPTPGMAGSWSSPGTQPLWIPNIMIKLTHPVVLDWGRIECSGSAQRPIFFQLVSLPHWGEVCFRGRADKNKNEGGNKLHRKL